MLEAGKVSLPIKQCGIGYLDVPHKIANFVG
jgi:hypothetical protein